MELMEKEEALRHAKFSLWTIYIYIDTHTHTRTWSAHDQSLDNGMD